MKKDFKKKLKEFKKYLRTHQFEAISSVIGLVLLIVGLFTIGWISIPIVALFLGLVFYSPQIIKFMTK